MSESLLTLRDVSKRERRAGRERLILAEVDLEVREGELVMIYGPRRAGKSTLLQIAAGLQAPDSGTVRFAGQDLAAQAERVLGQGIGYVQKTLRGSEEQEVLAQVAAPLLARGVGVDHARQAARGALERAGASDCAAARVAELSAGETVRVALARTLALSPALVVIDEPAGAVELSERDGILTVLRQIAGQGTAVLASTSEPEELAGAHRSLTLGEGRLRGPKAPEPAQVVALRRRV